jgi:hypothetical protein
MSRIEQAVMEEGEQQKFIEVWWPRMKRICLVCFLLDEDWDDHGVHSCRRVLDELGHAGIKNWAAKKVQVRYEAASCCYKCSRPGDMCDAASVGLSQGCLEPDMIVPVVLMGWLRKEMGVKDIVEEMAGREMKNIYDLFQWMTRRHYERTLSYWGTRGFRVWVEVIIRNKERFEGELDSDVSSDGDSEGMSEDKLEISW